MDLLECDEPVQKDSWSCGARTILVLRECAKNLRAGIRLPAQLPAGFYGATRLKWLLESMRSAFTTARQTLSDHSTPDTKRRRAEPDATPPNPTKADLKRPAETQVFATPCKKTKLLDKDCLQVAISDAKNAGVDFSRIFQTRHAELGCAMQKGHWRKWLFHLAARGPQPTCKACNSLSEIVQHSRETKQEETAVTEPAKPAEQIASNSAMEDSSGPTASTEPRRKRGRPGPEEAAFSIREWISHHRPGQWELLSSRPSSKWPAKCLACKSVQLLQRNSPKQIFRHEKACKAMKAQSSQAEVSSLSAESEPCHGVEVRNPACVLSNIPGSVLQWRTGGMLHCQEAGAPDKRLFTELAWRADGENLWLRSSQCVGEPRGNLGACKACAAAGSRRDLQREIALWAYRLHAFEYASSLLYGTDEEQQQWRQTMRTADYMQSKQAGTDVETLFSLDSLQQVRKIRHMLLSIPEGKRTPSLQKWLSFVNKQLEVRVECDNISGLTNPTMTRCQFCNNTYSYAFLRPPV